jgi:hypothetical protein
MSVRAALLLAFALVLAPLASAADATTPPADAPLVATSPFAVNVTHFVGPDATQRNASVPTGSDATLWVGMERLPANATAVVNLSAAGVTFDNATLTFVAAGNDSWTYRAANFMAPGTPGNVTYTLDVRVLDANGTQIGAATATGTLAVEGSAIVPAPAPGVPTGWLVGGGVAVLLLAGVLAFGARQRSIRKRMNEGPRRSQVMREMELEKQLEKVEEKDPEQAQQIKAEIRQQEQVREKRRELQILEAKRADVLKTMDLLRKRHEAGGLTKLQYDTMLKKRQVDLERIEAEIAQMEAEDAGGSAAA